MFDKFSERHIGVNNEKDLKAMLDVIGVKSTDELIAQVIPQSIRLKKPLALPAEGMSEYEFAAHIRELADRNRPLRSFIGMGYYPSAVPAAVARNVFENPAWYTSYTPYQAEISQGRLEALLNFQTAMISLTGMEIGNCSLLDEGTAAAEAMAMMFSLRSREAVKEGRNQLFVDRNVFENPAWYTSYTHYQAEISQGRLEALLNFQTAVISLTGMEIGNCSLLDEGTAAAEAMAMMFSLRSRDAVREGRNQLFVDRNIFPQTLEVLLTRSEPFGIELIVVDYDEYEFPGRELGALVQYPAAD